MAETRRERYGSDPEQFGLLTCPTGRGPHPVVVLLHGGFWKSAYGFELMEPLGGDLHDRGFAVWNLEYRRVGHVGGGFPGTLLDVAAGVDALSRLAGARGPDPARTAVVGHSAGGHLALWAASRRLLPAGAPGAAPDIVPVFAVGQAAVTDLRRCATDGLGTRAVERFLGGTPDEAPDAYRLAQPAIGAVPTLLVTGDRDVDVPADHSRRWSGVDGVEVLVAAGEDHYDVIDPQSASWRATAAALDAALRPRPTDREHSSEC